MNLDEFRAYVEANRKASREMALSALTAKMETEKKEGQENG